jgi:hypothetical protein
MQFLKWRKYNLSLKEKKEFKENETIADYFQGERVTLSYDTLSKIGKYHFIITS